MKIAIFGYGNLGRGVELAARQNPDMELVGVFTRRAPEDVKTLTGVKVYHESALPDFRGQIDVLVLCGGSATDLPTLTPKLVQDFHVVDSFDTHKNIPLHFAAVDKAAKESGHIACIAGGWDPGLFSVARLYASAVLPSGTDYTFWGTGISQGHSDAIRRIDGVLDARQYTVPSEAAMNLVRSGETPALSTREKHTRLCYVVAAPDADRAKIEKTIKEMPNYFADYDTTVHFVSAEILKAEHSGMPHGGSVIRNGKTGISESHTHTVEFRLRLDSNPEFTGSVLVAIARALSRMHARGAIGCQTIFDIAPGDLSPLSPEELRRQML